MENAPTTPRRSRLTKVGLICVFVSMLVLIPCLVLSRSIYERGRARPELHVKNTGTVPVLLRLGRDRAVARPGEDWGFRFSAGDSIEVFAGGTETGKSTTVMLSGKPYEKVQAEVTAEKDGQITFQFTNRK